MYVTLVALQSGKSLCLDITVTCPLATSYINRAAREAGAAAEMAAPRKEKYVDLGARFVFEPVAVETWAYSTHQPATSLKTLVGGSLLTRARRERPAIYTRGSRYWCSASTLSYCPTVCRPLTGRTDDRT